MYCPICNKKLISHYMTIYTCENELCIMKNAILSREQWAAIIEKLYIKAK